MQQVRTHTRLFCHTFLYIDQICPFFWNCQVRLQYWTKRIIFDVNTPPNAFSLNTDLKKFVLALIYVQQTVKSIKPHVSLTRVWPAYLIFFQMTDVFYFPPQHLYIYISYRTNTKYTITNTQDITECFWKKPLIRRQTSMGNNFKMAPVCCVFFFFFWTPRFLNVLINL